MSLPIQPYQRHENQANHNQSLLRENCFPNPCSPANCNYKDWNITIVFYTALHYVHSYLCKNSVRLGYRTGFKNHTDRNNYLARISMTDPLIAKILDDYIGLFHASCWARYTPCSYYYIKQKDICDYVIFASQTLPKTLGII
jgi:hypothetical protein